MTGKAAVYLTGRVAGGGGGGGGGAHAANPFPGTAAVTIPCRGRCATLDVFAASPDRTARHLNPDTGRAVYLVGRAWHPSKKGEALLQWCADTAAGNDTSPFRTLLGAFVVVIEDRRARTVTFVTDPLGLLPWFVGEYGGRLVAGSDVLGICDAGLSGGAVDYDSVAAWLCYNFVPAGGTLVRDYRRLPGATVATFDAAGRLVSESAYATLKYVRNVVPPDGLIEGLHGRVAASFHRLIDGVDEVNLPLSGGYDSRLMVALASEHGGARGLRSHLTVVESTPAEADVARRVADALRTPLRVLPVGGRNVDLFDDPLYFIPEGFPVARNLTNAVARLRPGMPVLSGFMGDVLMRGPVNAAVRDFLAKDDRPLDDAQLARAAHDRFRIRTHRLHLLRDGLEARAEARATASLLPVIRQGRAAGRPLAFANLTLRHRLYFAGIFLSHLDVADALLPFPSWDLVEYHAAHNGSFDAGTYDRLFARFYPALAGIPHDSDVRVPPPPASSSDNTRRACSRPSRHVRRWGRELLGSVPRKWGTTAITPRKLLKRLPGAFLARPRYADEVGYLHRIHAFEERLRRANLRLDWDSV